VVVAAPANVVVVVVVVARLAAASIASGKIAFVAHTGAAAGTFDTRPVVQPAAVVVG
jgi:hypothetical protein